MMCVLYILIFLWAKVFGYDLVNTDLMLALLATDVLMLVIGGTISEFNK